MTEVISSDLHFWHRKILELCPETRPYKSVEHMNECVVHDMNKFLGNPEVTTFYFLGDFSFKGRKATEEILKQLKNPKKIVMVEGNHDKKLEGLYKEVFGEVHWYLERNFHVDESRVKVCMMHFPIESWNTKNHGAVHLHGHSHGPYVTGSRRRDVGIDACGVITDIHTHIRHALQDEVVKNHHAD